jgi:hypothetical protein
MGDFVLVHGGTAEVGLEFCAMNIADGTGDERCRTVKIVADEVLGAADPANVSKRQATLSRLPSSFLSLRPTCAAR